MEYSFANTYRKNADTYIEDRGFLRTVSRENADFETVDAKFGSKLQTGQTAVHSADGEGWVVVDGDDVTPVYVRPLAKTLRARRDALLAETDYLMMPDYPLEPAYRTRLEAYRQALRDLPQQEGWPGNVEWPAKPEKEPGE